MDERLNEALDQIQDAHIAEAADYKKRTRPYWLGAVAAVLAVAVAWTAVWHRNESNAPDISLRDPAVMPAPTFTLSTAPISDAPVQPEEPAVPETPPQDTMPSPTNTVPTAPLAPITPVPPDVPHPETPTAPETPPQDTMPSPPNTVPTAPLAPITPVPPDVPHPETPTAPDVAPPEMPTGPVLVPLAKLAAQPVYPKRVTHPMLPNGGSWKEYYAQYDQPEGYADGLDRFLRESITSVLRDADGQNKTCSPLNIYMALAMLAEVSQGDSRQQILDLLGCDSIEALRTQTDHLWNAHYRADGANASLLANSLWLDDIRSYAQSTADTLAQRYYASVFCGDLGSEEMNETLRDWLNAQTDGLLQDAVKDVKLSPETIFALASTVYYRAKWQDGFNEEKNTQDLFHAASGDTTVTYMHRTLRGKQVYQGKGYRAVALALEDDSRMWLILPDEGSSPKDLLTRGDCVDLILGDDPGSVTADVVLSLPRFDISSKQDLKEQLWELGVTDVFTGAADFSPLTGQTGGIYVDKVEHATRVAIDEEGVTAAAYTIIDAPTSGMPQEREEIRFTLDRPFLFAITSQDGLPLFTGIVERP